MTYPSLAVIGTAGRKDDKAKLNHVSYQRMVQGAIKLIQHLNIDHNNLKLFSGGAAWADHVVVTLALLGAVRYENVTIFMPSILTDTGYMGEGERASKTASTANWYHKIFGEITGKQPIRDLLDIRERGATLIPGNGSFHARNSDVAKSVSPDGVLLAYTFGPPELKQPPWTIRQFDPDTKADDAGLKDGGTADTWNKCSGSKWHGVLGDAPIDSSVI